MSGETQENKIQLFGSINFISQEHLELFLDQLEPTSSLYCIIEAVKYAHLRGAYTIGETEVISKAIRTISKLNDGTPPATR
jgi:hypothetical protein